MKNTELSLILIEGVGVWKSAITTKEISGSRIPTIPVGTRFEVLVLGNSKQSYSSCRGLPINLIYNDEFSLDGYWK